MTIFFADYILYSKTAEAIRTILGIHLAFMVSPVTLQGIEFAKKNVRGKVAMDIVFQRKKTELKSSKRCGSSEHSRKGKKSK
jgi:hypothetical protein